MRIPLTAALKGRLEFEFNIFVRQVHLPYKLGLVSIESISDLHSPFLVVVLAQECWECKLGVNWCHNDGGNSVEFLSEAFFVRINSNFELILRSKIQENHDIFLWDVKFEF